VVEHNLAKVGVASSNLVSRSNVKLQHLQIVKIPKKFKVLRQGDVQLCISFPAPMLKLHRFQVIKTL
jgi:hypothetical protein